MLKPVAPWRTTICPIWHPFRSAASNARSIAFGMAASGQAVRDEPGRAFEELPIFVREGVQFVALRVDHPENVPVFVPHRNNDFRAGGVKSRQVTHILMHIADDN